MTIQFPDSNTRPDDPKQDEQVPCRPKDIETRLKQARRVLAKEQRRTEAERDAFGEFHRIVSTLQPQTMGPNCDSTRTTQWNSTETALTEPSSLRSVRKAYTATVLAVPHYEQEYSNPYHS